MKLYFSNVFGAGFGQYGGHYAHLCENLRRMRDSCEYFAERPNTLSRPEVYRAIKLENAKVIVDYNDNVDLGSYLAIILAKKDVISWAAFVRNAVSGCSSRFDKADICGAFPHFVGDALDELSAVKLNNALVSIQGVTSIKAAQRINTLDKLFGKTLCDSDGHVLVKAHFQNATNIELLTRYPIVSASTNLWQTIGNDGDIFLPFNGKVIGIDEYHAGIGEKNRHLLSVSEMEREQIHNFISSTGVEVDSLATSIPRRWAWNMWSLTSYMAQAQHGTNRPFLYTATLF
jgi:hypothetical protein